MILILSDKHDIHADVVENKLNKMKIDVFRFNLDVESLQETLITFSNDSWIFSQNRKCLYSRDIQAVWFRRAFVELLLEEKDCREVDFLMW